jgi:protein subunit release factor A
LKWANTDFLFRGEKMSGKIQKNIEINAKIKTSLEGMDKAVSDLEKGLEKQKFDLGKNSGLSKLIKDYKEAKAQLGELMSDDVIARADIKKAESLGTKISRLYKQIGKSFQELRSGNDDTFKKMFPGSFTAQISKGTKAIDAFFSKLDSKSVKEGRIEEARKDLKRLENDLDQIKGRRLKIDVDIDREGAKKQLDRINQDLEKMREEFKKKLIPEEPKDSKGRTKTEKLSSSVTTWTNKLSQDTDARKNLRV